MDGADQRDGAEPSLTVTTGADRPVVGLPHRRDLEDDVPDHDETRAAELRSRSAKAAA